MHQVVLTLAWLACVIYATIPSFWFLIHPRVDYWRKQRSPYRIVVPAWVAMWIVLAVITARWHDIVLYSSKWAWLPAAGLFAIGLLLYARSGKDFSAAQLGGIPEIVPNHREQRLVTWGIRSRVRHPVYTAHLCEMLAWSIGTGLVVCYALAAFAIITGTFMIRMEDRELEQRFGEEYRRYRKRVPAILPSLYRIDSV